MGNSTHAEEFAKAYPERYFEMFIAEQQLIAAAVGMSVRGYVPFAATFAAFFTRAYDFIRMSAISAANIRLCGSHAGTEIGADGPSQMALEDLAMMRAVHGSTVLYPSDATSAAYLVREMAGRDGIVYMRTTRGAYPVLYGPDEEFPVGGAKVVRSSPGDQVTLIGAGVTLHGCLAAADQLGSDGISARVLDLYSLKPIDTQALLDAAAATGGGWSWPRTTTRRAASAARCSKRSATRVTRPRSPISRSAACPAPGPPPSSWKPPGSPPATSSRPPATSSAPDARREPGSTHGPALACGGTRHGLPGPAASAWAPLRIRLFRTLWIASLVSNVGTWMQTVGAQWLVVHDAHAAILVSLVQTAYTLPAVLFALVGGVLADIFDRVRLLVAVLAGMTATGAALTVLTAAHRMPPALLLMFTFVLGTGAILVAPAYQSLVPDMVPRQQLPAAAALSSININLARAIGPAIAGLLVAQIGVAAVFALNTATFLLFAVVVACHPRLGGTPQSSERFLPGLRAGGRYVRHAPVVRRILLRAALFLVPGSCAVGAAAADRHHAGSAWVRAVTACCSAPWGSAPSAARSSCRRSGRGCRPMPWWPPRA